MPSWLLCFWICNIRYIFYKFGTNKQFFKKQALVLSSGGSQARRKSKDTCSDSSHQVGCGKGHKGCIARSSQGDSGRWEYIPSWGSQGRLPTLKGFVLNHDRGSTNSRRSRRCEQRHADEKPWATEHEQKFKMKKNVRSDMSPIPGYSVKIRILKGFSHQGEMNQWKAENSKSQYSKALPKPSHPSFHQWKIKNLKKSIAYFFKTVTHFR